MTGSACDPARAGPPAHAQGQAGAGLLQAASAGLQLLVPPHLEPPLRWVAVKLAACCTTLAVAGACKTASQGRAPAHASSKRHCVWRGRRRWRRKAAGERERSSVQARRWLRAAAAPPGPCFQLLHSQVACCALPEKGLRAAKASRARPLRSPALALLCGWWTRRPCCCLQLQPHPQLIQLLPAHAQLLGRFLSGCGQRHACVKQPLHHRPRPRLQLRSLAIPLLPSAAGLGRTAGLWHTVCALNHLKRGAQAHHTHALVCTAAGSTPASGLVGKAGQCTKQKQREANTARHCAPGRSPPAAHAA